MVPDGKEPSDGSHEHEQPPERVPHDFFIGREDERATIQQFLTPESEHQLLEIYTNGAGGIGKTSLLEKTLASCLEKTDQFIATQEFIDFYHTACRSRIGVLQELARTLDNQAFPEFNKLASTYLQEPDPSKRKKNLSDIEKAFIREYATFTKGRQPILFFDTYEFIQRTPLQGQTAAEGTGLSRWMETKFFPELLKDSPATRIIVSGRYPLQDISCSLIAVKRLELQPFEIQDTTRFLQQCLRYSNQQELIARIGSAEDIGKIQALSNGHPILIALFVDWISYSQNPLSPREFIATIEADTKHDQHTAFEKTLIKRVSALASPEDIAVIAMAVAYHRMTPAMFQALNPDVSTLQCQAIFDQLRKFSFVKQKAPDIVLLHDEMRRMVVEWLFNDPQDKSRFIRRALVEDLVQYYEELLKQPDLSDTEREIYTTERLEYVFLADSETGLTNFRTEFEENFDTYIDDGKYDYCDMLLRDAEMIHRENPGLISFPDHVTLDWRRIQYNNKFGGDSQESIDIANDVLQKHENRWYGNYDGKQYDFRSHSLHGKILMERGIGEFRRELFEDALTSLHAAYNVFVEVADYTTLHWCNNWIGYVHYRQSHFSQAEIRFNQSRDGFYNLLLDYSREHASGLPTSLHRKTQFRFLLQGLQVCFGNSAILNYYLGRFDTAIRYAEIAFAIARALPQNAVEIVRGRATLGRVFAGIGRSIDARHHLNEAQCILQDLEEPFLKGRINTDLGFLSYRGSELERIIEYYRAVDVAQIIKKYAQSPTELQQAERYIATAVSIAGEEKERSDAYYALGELCVVMPEDDHWQRAEDAFLSALDLARKSRFEYRVIDTLESLVTLYYFWNHSDDKLAAYQQELDQFHQVNPKRYPDLFAKYYITLGDSEYDHGFSCLNNSGESTLSSILDHFQKAFEHYCQAIVLMKEFHIDAFYGACGLFYSRLRTLVNECDEQKILSHIFDTIEKTLPHTIDTDDTVHALYRSARILIGPSESPLRQQLDRLQKMIQSELDQGNWGKALLFTDCLLGIYRVLLRIHPEHDAYLEELIFYLRAKSVYYRRLGNMYQADRYLAIAKDNLSKLKELPLQYLPKECLKALEGSLKSVEGTLLYRRGGFEQMLEFYLCDELDVARQKFNAEFGVTVRTQALELLKEAEEMLDVVISNWDQQPSEIRPKLLYQRYRARLGDTRFRIGELLMVHEDFALSTELQNKVFGYFKHAIADAEASDYAYLQEHARQGWFNALYFSGLPDTSDAAKVQQQQLEAQLEQMAHSQGTVFPSVMGRFRITQGDRLFSSYFQQDCHRVEEGTYAYIRQEHGPANPTILGRMLRYYVEACDFMAQHGHQDFATAMRTLQRRIELITDIGALHEIQRAFQPVWNNQPHLVEKNEELRTLVQFAQLRSFILENGTQN